jgi:hypothetical protein
VEVTHSYAVSPTQLFEVITDMDFLEERGHRYGGVGQPTVRKNDGIVVVTATRQIPVDKVPRMARRYLGDGRLTQTDRWGDRREENVTATLAVDPGAMPVDVSGNHEIRATPQGCRHITKISLKVKVPLVGGALAGPVAAQLEKLLSAEMRFAETWLDQRSRQ